MPITPFHFGPGAALHSVGPNHLSFLAFCAANVLIDIEPLYYILTHQERLHRFFHTYVGASVVAVATWCLFVVARAFARRFWLPNPFTWQGLSTRAVAIGAAVGTYSHIVLDSVMHSDITPFAPFSDANPMFRLVSLSVLHWFCLLSGVAAICVLGLRYFLQSRDAP